MSCEAISRRSSGNIVDLTNLYREASIPPEPREWPGAIPSEPWERPEVVVRDSKSHSGLGTEANPIMIGDEFAPLGSAFNPVVIDVDEGWCHGEADQPVSDADTEIMTTPEFWENLIEESYANPANGGADVDLTSVPARTRPPLCDDPDIQVLDKLVTECTQSDERARILAESILGVGENAHSRDIATCGTVQHKRESVQDAKQGRTLSVEPMMSHNVTEVSLTDSDAIMQEPADPTDKFLTPKEPSFASSEARPIRHKFPCFKDVPAGLRRSKRLISSRPRRSERLIKRAGH